MSVYPQLIAAAKASPRQLDLATIKRAWDFAVMAHTGQKRRTGEPFVEHPGETALTLVEWKLDTQTVVAGLLHDTIEDGGATRQDLVKEFGEEVALLVDGVTKISSIRLKNDTQAEFMENLRKMILVMARDLRVVLVKLADRLHNMRTLQGLLPHKRKRFATETLEIYAPLAERLGIGYVKGELEDLAFPFVYPKAYNWLKTYSEPYYKEADTIAKKMRQQLLTNLAEADIKDAKLQVRAKYLYSLYSKLLRPEHDKDITKIHDIMALRIIVPSIEQCYIALGIVHRLYRPVLYLGIRDFIANPKPNGYRSIHTNVIGPKGHICEVQIRTPEMQVQAELGVAAHWYYSELKAKAVPDRILEKKIKPVPAEKLKWVKELAAWQKQITDNEEYLRALKFDALQHRDLVFSPKGDVYDLPAKATPVDYAYRVHTQVGHQTSGAKVNGRLVPLNHQLQNGDIVEIIVDRHRKKPNPDWLKFVVTTMARHAITKALKA